MFILMFMYFSNILNITKVYAPQASVMEEHKKPKHIRFRLDREQVSGPRVNHAVFLDSHKLILPCFTPCYQYVKYF